MTVDKRAPGSGVSSRYRLDGAHGRLRKRAYALTSMQPARYDVPSMILIMVATVLFTLGIYSMPAFSGAIFVGLKVMSLIVVVGAVAGLFAALLIHLPRFK